MPNRPPTFNTKQAKRRPDDRPSAYQRGYGGKAWKRLRLEVYTRDAGKCQADGCGRAVAGQEAHIDHIIPKAAGGADAAFNLQVLCRSCHSRKTARERLRATGGAAGGRG